MGTLTDLQIRSPTCSKLRCIVLNLTHFHIKRHNFVIDWCYTNMHAFILLFYLPIKIYLVYCNKPRNICQWNKMSTHYAYTYGEQTQVLSWQHHNSGKNLFRNEQV